MALGRTYASASSMYLSNANAIGGTYPFTFACWFYCTNDSADRTLMTVSSGVATNNNSHRLYLGISAGPVAGPVKAASRTTSTVEASSSVNYTVNTLQHACAVFTSATNRAAFLNGGNKGTDTTNRTPSGMSSTQIGRFASITAYMEGDIFVPCIWNVALSDAEVAILANGAWPRRVRPANIIGFWPCGYSSPEVDLSGQNRAMTLNNAPTIATRSPRLQLPFGYDQWQVSTGFTPAAVTLRMLASTGVGK